MLNAIPMIRLLNHLSSLLPEGNRGFTNLLVVGTDIRYTCPFHKDGREKSPSCYTSCEDGKEGLTYCFSCGYKAGIATLISDAAGIPFHKAVDLAQSFEVPVGGRYSGFDENGLRKFSLKFLSKKKKEMKVDFKLPDDVTQDIPYLERRGIKKRVYVSHGCLYSESLKRLYLPLGGSVYASRSVEGEHAWHYPQGCGRVVWYGLGAADSRRIFLCEGFIDSMTLDCLDIPSVAFGGLPTYKQLDELLLKTDALNFVCCFDGDRGGATATKRVLNRLSDKAILYMVKMPRGKDANDMGDELKGLPVVRIGKPLTRGGLDMIHYHC